MLQEFVCFFFYPVFGCWLLFDHLDHATRHYQGPGFLLTHDFYLKKMQYCFTRQLQFSKHIFEAIIFFFYKLQIVDL